MDDYREMRVSIVHESGLVIEPRHASPVFWGRPRPKLQAPCFPAPPRTGPGPSLITCRLP